MGMRIEWVGVDPMGSDVIGPGQWVGGAEEPTGAEVNLYVGGGDGAMIQGSFEDTLSWLHATTLKVLAARDADRQSIGYVVESDAPTEWLASGDEEWTGDLQAAKVYGDPEEAAHDSRDLGGEVVPVYRHVVGGALTTEVCPNDDECEDCQRATVEIDPPLDPTTPRGALSYAIFALNTLLHPDASSAQDCERLDAEAERVIETLAAMRDGSPA